MALLGVLEPARHDNGPAFLIKGGVSIELRLGLRARATQDVDFVFRGTPGRMFEAVEEAFAVSYSGFSFRRKGEVHIIRDTESRRFSVQASFAGRDWQTLQLEVGPPEATESELVPAAISIEDFKLDAPRQVACLSLRYQIAQKLHAVTERPPNRANHRFWDLVDLILLRALVDDLPPVRAACVEIFTARDTHPWPPHLDVPKTWAAPYRRLATELGFSNADLEDAAANVREFVASIDTASR